MRRDGIVNARLASALAGLRHTDLFAISDSGFPTVAGDVVDLAVVYGLPEFAPVLAAVLAEVVIDNATMATETEVNNPAQAQRLRSHLGDVAQVSHAELKALAAGTKFVVRTGVATPYANVVLQAGVAFA